MHSLSLWKHKTLLTENNIFMFKHNSKVRNYFENWFEEIKKWDTRDQLCNSIFLRKFNKEELMVWIPSRKNMLYQFDCFLTFSLELEP